MDRLVESVPNFSEGISASTLVALGDALASVSGSWLLDHTADADHHRSVFSVAGDPVAITAALERSVAVAIERIDMRQHRGQHPRIGAVDVVPFIPLGASTMADCVEMAHQFGGLLVERF